MRPGLPAWRHLASRNKKCAYRYQNNELWSYKMLAGRPKLCYFMYLSKLTKWSDKLVAVAIRKSGTT